MVKILGINEQLSGWIIAKDHPPSAGICGSDRGSGCRVLPDRPLVPVAGSLLGTHVDIDSHAVDPECRAAYFCAVCRGDSRRSSSWCGHRRLFSRKHWGVWCGGFHNRIALRCIAS